MPDAQDTVSDALATVLQKYRSLPADRDFAPWAYRVLRNKIGDRLRENVTRSGVFESTGRIEEYADAVAVSLEPETRLALIRCLRRMAREFPLYARALNLLNLGYVTDEVCRRLGVRRNYLYVLLHRCRHWLSECLEKGVGTDD